MTETIVYVAALTYKRPEGVSELLEGWLRLRRPAGCEVRFLLVDNDPEGSAGMVAEGAMAGFGGHLHYIVEPEPGIPAARNRALRETMGRGGTLLCFLDDDETPDPDWLVEMISHWRRTGAVLIGGPLRRTLSGAPRSPLHSFFARSLVARRTLAERRAAKAAEAGKPVPVYTSNWMCELSVMRERGFWFEGSMRFSGGSDVAFYRAVCRQGLPTSWCATAIVSEPIEADRLTIGYQFRRSRDQGIVMARLQGKPRPRLYAEQLPRAAAGIVLMAVPLLGLASFAAGLHLLASAAGHIAATRGKESALYARRVATS